MKKYFLLSLALLLFAYTAFANEINAMAFDFVAPSVYDINNLNDDYPVGSLVYDSQSHEFYGKQGQTGGWVNLSDVTRQYGMEIDTTCSSASCNPTREFGGNWVSNLTRSATGQYTVNFTGGTFGTGEEPVCVVTSLNSNALDHCKLNTVASTSGIQVYCYNSTTSAAMDARFSLMCITN